MTTIVHLVEEIISTASRHHVDHDKSAAITEHHLVYHGQEALHT